MGPTFSAGSLSLFWLREAQRNLSEKKSMPHTEQKREREREKARRRSHFRAGERRVGAQPPPPPSSVAPFQRPAVIHSAAAMRSAAPLDTDADAVVHSAAAIRSAARRHGRLQSLPSLGPTTVATPPARPGGQHRLRPSFYGGENWEGNGGGGERKKYIGNYIYVTSCLKDNSTKK